MYTLSMIEHYVIEEKSFLPEDPIAVYTILSSGDTNL